MIKKEFGVMTVMYLLFRQKFVVIWVNAERDLKISLVSWVFRFGLRGDLGGSFVMTLDPDMDCNTSHRVRTYHFDTIKIQVRNIKTCLFENRVPKNSMVSPCSYYTFSITSVEFQHSST